MTRIPKSKKIRQQGKNAQAADQPVTIEVLVEEESASTALRPLIHKILEGTGARFQIRHFRGKPDLIKRLPERLRGYAQARKRGEDLRVVVLVDRDSDDCAVLKADLDAIAREAGLTPRAGTGSGSSGSFHVLTCVAVRELESWYFGDWEAVRAGFPKVPKDAPRAYRSNPDSVDKKCSDDFEKMLRASRVNIASKPEWGRRVGPNLSVDGNKSPSFRAFVKGVRDIASS
ncbi:DUF4276 family protein [Streptomyces sp. NPDC054796]